MTVNLQARGALVNSEFIVGMCEKGNPFVRMNIDLGDGQGGIVNKQFNMSLNTFYKLEQTSSNIRSLCSQ